MGCKESFPLKTKGILVLALQEVVCTMCEGGMDLGKGTDDKPLSQDLHPRVMSALRFQNFTSSTLSFETPAVPTAAPSNSSVLLPYFAGQEHSWFSGEKEHKGRERDREGTVGPP